ncbi:MAG: hypothetical protein IJA61_02125 [Clostridia bacterium]|nr:hypothetical protein [Clostridia bacterium]
MTKKAKIIVAAVAAFLVLVIAGLAVGLVLVAQQVQMTNSVSVTYNANNVDCEITTYGIHYLKMEDHYFDACTIREPLAEGAQEEVDGDMMAVLIEEKDAQGNVTKLRSATDTIRAYENAGSGDATTIATRTRTFEDVVLKPVENEDDGESESSVVGYYFKIKNNCAVNIIVTVAIGENPTKDNNITKHLLGQETETDITTTGLPVIIEPNAEGYVGVAMFITTLSESADFQGNIIVSIQQV